jgi:hypothetical protein
VEELSVDWLLAGVAHDPNERNSWADTAHMKEAHGEPAVAELGETSAHKLASEKAVVDAIELLPGDTWSGRRFSDGWLVSLSSSDPLRSTGSHHFVVLDVGLVFRESGSLPPFEYVAKHSRAGRDLVLAVDGGRLMYNEQGGVGFHPG